MDTHFEAINWGLAELAGSSAPRASRRRRSRPPPRARSRASTPGWSASWATGPGSMARPSAGATSRDPFVNGSAGQGTCPPDGLEARRLAGPRQRPALRRRDHGRGCADMVRSSAMGKVAELVEQGPLQARIPRPPPRMDDQVRWPRRRLEGPRARQHPLRAGVRLMTSEFILHHYDTSPFSEKVRVMLGVKGLAWRSVIQPVIMPKPDLRPADRRLSAHPGDADRRRHLLRHPGDPGRDRGAPARARRWSRAATGRSTCGPTGCSSRRPWRWCSARSATACRPSFIADREKLSGRPFDMAAMKAAAGPMKAQWRAHAAWIERGLASERFPWRINAVPGRHRSLHERLVAAAARRRARRTPCWTACRRPPAWRERMKALGHGRRSEMTGAEALAVAKAATPAAAPGQRPGRSARAWRRAPP